MRLDAYAPTASVRPVTPVWYSIHRNFGDSEGGPRPLVDVGLQLQDWTAAVAYARTLPGMARTLSPSITARITALAVRDFAAAGLGRPPVMVPIVGHPGEVALMNAPDAYRGFLRLVPNGMQVVNEVAARFGMKVFTYHPGRLAAKVPCPTLFCVCEADSVAPAGQRSATPQRRRAARSSYTNRGISTSMSTTPSSAPSPTSSHSWTSI